MKIENVTIGSDPEVFIYQRGREEFISSIGLIPGTKGNAVPMGNLGRGFGLQIDNVLAEYNIPPVTSKEQFIKNIEKGRDYIDSFLKENYGKEYGIVCAASAYFQNSELKSKEALEFGCSSDINAWTEETNPKPEGDKTNLRTTGCHIHIGYDNPKTYISIELVKALDLFLGVPSVILDKDTERRQLYGKAGSFRLTPYGVEYRVLSGYFIDNAALIGWMYDQTMEAIKFVNEEKTVDNFNNAIVSCINNSNYKLAQEICAKNNLKLI